MGKREKVLWFVLILSLTGNALLSVSLVQDPYKKIGYLETDQPLVDYVISDYAKENHASIERAIGGRFPVIITLDDRKCVSLKLKKGYIGFSPVYCFDRQTGELVYKRVRQM